jgi:hypothetical protein
MRIDNFAAVCRVPDCHGRIKPYDGKYLSRGTCEKCGMDQDEWLRVNRPDEWKARARAEAERLKAQCDAMCGHVTIKVRE